VARLSLGLPGPIRVRDGTVGPAHSGSKRIITMRIVPNRHHNVLPCNRPTSPGGDVDGVDGVAVPSGANADRSHPVARATTTHGP